MNSVRIYTIVKKLLLLTLRDAPRITDMLFWPIIDIAIWGFTGAWLQTENSSDIKLMLLGSIVLWQVTWRASVDIWFSLYDELSSRNVLNLFVTPLSLFEWLVSTVLLGIIKTMFNLPYSALIIWFLYGINIFSVGFSFFVWVALLFLSGVLIGLITAALLFIFGQRLQSVMWLLPWTFIPFSGVYYSISVLPAWTKPISYSLPMTYVFEAMRTFIATGAVMTHYLFIGFVLNIIFLAISLVIFKLAFDRARNRGLVQLEKE